MAILRYEERVRIERANGLRKPDQCVESGSGCSVYGSDEAYKDKSFSDIVEEPVKVFKPEYKAAAYQLVDANPCDGRTIGVVETISDSDRSTATVKQAHTVITHTTAVEDTAFDEPTERAVVTTTIKADAEATQPVAVNATTAEEVALSEVSDGENSGRKSRTNTADTTATVSSSATETTAESTSV